MINLNQAYATPLPQDVALDFNQVRNEKVVLSHKPNCILTGQQKDKVKKRLFPKLLGHKNIVELNSEQKDAVRKNLFG